MWEEKLYFSLVKSGKRQKVPLGQSVSTHLSPIVAFNKNHMLGTLDFTGSEYWAPPNFPESTALCVLSI